MEKLNDQEKVRLNKFENLQNNNLAFSESKYSHSDWNELESKFANHTKEDLENLNIRAAFAGRIIAQRGPFLVIQNNGLHIQLYIDKRFSQSEKYHLIFENLDLGDIIEAEGYLFKTKTQQLSLHVSDFLLLTKSLKPLPDQYYGLSDQEEKYRKRYLDLIVNTKTRDTFIKRSRIVSYIRHFFDNQNYLEVDTPVLQPILGGASARPFITHYNSLHRDYYLRIATELPLKKLLVGGIDRVYEIGKIFRNEGVDTTHNPEFTSIEFYQAYANLETMMQQTENLFQFLIEKINNSNPVLNFGEYQIDFSKPFARINMVEEVSKKVGHNFYQISEEQAKQIAQDHDIKVEPFYTKGHIINELFEKYIEEELIQPTFVTGHPIEISPLAKKDPKNNNFTQRAELFIAKKEFANMFNELNDPFDQLARFESQISEKNMGNEEASEIDYDFVESLYYGLPPAGGCGIGIDRLVMLFTNNESIREVILYPQLKTKKE
ncbi:lysyl-tRNA synthetase [Mesomycoplasma conjunctivae]|uniref:Lysine--tRNA ligase n=1 Tax=Mesomycoplasma conjunctivae (strain ATCC 25834 / NCTC 10147 / HRC/581) TaxID=572263 RepID=C5J6A8_MESCH|nr:lysine--tRNA ligase [Mesomycoplasma conjunctivae]CAT05000.1 Lysyl-tRNA synthetase [Mesomycoplasma conjunctivae]VEU66339.1 lysyl-tRNA synthetase [Mesomycoplasma conjunctivae]